MAEIQDKETLQLAFAQRLQATLDDGVSHGASFSSVPLTPGTHPAAAARKVAREARLIADMAEAAARGITLWMLEAGRRPEIVVPMAGYYARDDAFEARRAEFYAHVALVYASQGWIFSNPSVAHAAEAGYGERGRTLQPIDKESSAITNVTSAPLEWLVATGRMETKADRPGHGLVRYTAALRYRTAMEGAGVGVKAQSYEGASGGGAPGRPLPDFRLDCMASIDGLKLKPDYKLLESVVWNDEWLWRATVKRGTTAKQWKAARKKALPALRKRARHIILRLHKVLDRTAVYYGLMDSGEFHRRWSKKGRRVATPAPGPTQKAGGPSR